MKAQQIHDNNIPLTRPIDTSQNTLLHRKQQARIWASLQLQSKYADGKEIGSIASPSKETDAQTAPMTATERREHGSFQSSGNDNFEFIASVNSSNGVEFPKAHYLKRGCHKLLNFASR